MQKREKVFYSFFVISEDRTNVGKLKWEKIAYKDEMYHCKKCLIKSAAQNSLFSKVSITSITKDVKIQIAG